MSRRGSEFLVGLSILGALALIVAGALFLSEADFGRTGQTAVARFRSIGRLQAGGAVIHRGVRIGTVQAVRLAENGWVEADLTLERDVAIPERPAVIALPASLFGEWQAEVVGQTELPDNPVLRQNIAFAARGAGDRWPGSDLPGIGELTAQANRIANDVSEITARVESAIDSVVINDLRGSVADLRDMVERLTLFTREQTGTLGRVARRADTISSHLEAGTGTLRRTLDRVDTATSQGELTEIVANLKAASQNARDMSGDFRELSASIKANQESVIRTLSGLDSAMSRLQRGDGTLGKLTMDSTLYVETTAAVSELRALLADIRVNPRKYFRFSVF